MENKSQLISTLLIGIALVGAAYILSSASLNIRTTQTSVTEDGSLTNAITVSGDGTAVREPDLVDISVSVSERDFSTKVAQQNTNEKISQILQIAKGNGVDDKKIKTTQLSIRPVYEWETSRQVFKGYEATQTVNIESAYNKDNPAVTNMLDGIAAVQDAQINSINFDYENKKELAEEARELAYKSAEEKAVQLARLSGVKLGKPISITDQSYQYNRSTLPTAKVAYDMMGSAPESTQISGGELEHQITVNVVFAIE